MSISSTTSEIINVGPDYYEFCFNFASLRELDEDRGRNCFVDAQTLSTGESCPGLVLDVIEVAIIRFNKEDIHPTLAREEAKKFIDRAGFQTAHTVAQRLLAFALVGDVKKHVLKSLDNVINELNRTSGIEGSRLKVFIGRLWLWVYRTLNFGGLVWLIFSDYGLRSL